MEILEETNLGKHLFHKYSSNPKNWNFIISTTPIRDHFFDAIISSPNEVWQLKLDSIYKPNPFIVGTKIDNIDSNQIDKNINTKITTFGYRKINDNKILNLLKTLSEEQQDNSNKDHNISLNSLLSEIEPVAPKQGDNYIYGPFLFTNKNLLSINEKQKNISERLSDKIRANLRNKYLSYG
ncbi:MAG: hypothetical protein DA328_06380 [Nitrososphaeraceae archaeon]|nr:hypothetical protein [Nitrososphaeraceae archaeon]